MRLLLDTHALLWWLDGSLSTRATEAIAHDGNLITVSAVTMWEAGIKQALGKLRLDVDLVAQCDNEGFGLLPITGRHAQAAARLPRHHDDPFDRMLVAQAIDEDMVLVTRDRRMEPYDARLLGA